MTRFWRKSLQQNLPYPLQEARVNHSDYQVWLSGHSLGGALASLATADMRNKPGSPPESQLQLYSFGQPRVGGVVFAEAFHQLAPAFFRVTHARDAVSVLFPRRLGYRHFPTEVRKVLTFSS